MIKIISIALVCAIIIVYLKNINSELTILVEIMSGIMLISLIAGYVQETFSFINKLIDLTGLDKEIYKIIFKITAVGYLVEFGASTIEDFGLSSLANKLVLAGKIIILSMSMPIIYAVFNLIMGIME